MNENQKNGKKEETPKLLEGVQQASTSGWKRLLSKKWVFPATYMAAAAIILTLMWVYQGSGTKNHSADSTGLTSSKSVTDTVSKPDSTAVMANSETMQWPVKDKNEMQVVLPFYDKNASNEVRQTAMVEYDNTMTPHVGVDLARNDNQPFDVLAAMSGKVTLVQKDPLVGTIVEITHGNSYVTVYQSLADVKVAKDDQVKKGDVIAQAGRSELEKDQGVHVHFEVRQGADGAAVNPEQLITQK